MTAASFRTATLPELSRILDWAADEGWNPGIEDAEAFFAADPGGFFVADHDGTPVAAISVVNHSDSFAFLGLYICHPDWRGTGLGFALWTHAIAHAGGRTIGLDGVPAQQDNYARSGFELAGRTRRLVATAWSCHSPTGPAARRTRPRGPRRLALAQERDLETIRALDRAANGFDRAAFLAAWVAEHPTRKTVLLETAGRVTGFATARLCREVCKIGPIVAPSDTDAMTLAGQAAAALGQTDISIDVPMGQPDFARMLEARGFQEGFATARMYRGPAPAVDATLKAIATMELG